MSDDRDSRRARNASDVATEKLRAAMQGIGEVMSPGSAEEPILAPHTRRAVYEWLAELRAADDLQAAGIKPRCTVLMSGPPGCGKTTLAHHVAARLGIPMVSIGSENIMASMLGESEAKVAKMFAAFNAVKEPFVVLFDEIEAVGGRRDLNSRGGADNARTSILTVLLRRIENFHGIMMAATNRPQDLDPALWRRFGLQMTVDLPGEDERYAILKRYASPFAFAEDDLERLVDVTAGASPALLRGLMEGVKRSLVLAPRLKLDISSSEAVLGAVLAAVRPPPEIDPPVLWRDGGAALMSAFVQWPPVRGDV